MTNGTQQPRKTKGKQIREQQQIRMKEALKARIRRYQEKVHADTGLEINFSSATRSLIERGLDAAGIA
jgi:hypothetical protein